MRRLTFFTLCLIHLCLMYGCGGGGNNDGAVIYELNHSAITLSGVIPANNINQARVLVNGNEAIIEGLAWVFTLNGTDPAGTLYVEYQVDDVTLSTHEIEITRIRENIAI